MAKIAFMGAGSTVFAKNLLGDILTYPELAGSTIALHDIDVERLNTTKNVAKNGSRNDLSMYLSNIFILFPVFRFVGLPFSAETVALRPLQIYRNTC